MRIKKSFNVAILVGIAALVMAFSSCGEDSPENAVAVQDFDLNNYIGKWYEIARIDFKHEKNMDNVTAEYEKIQSRLIYEYEKVKLKVE